MINELDLLSYIILRSWVEYMKEFIYFSSNKCVCCGMQIPEGKQVCEYCLDEDYMDDKKEINKIE